MSNVRYLIAAIITGFSVSLAGWISPEVTGFSSDYNSILSLILFQTCFLLVGLVGAYLVDFKNIGFISVIINHKKNTVVSGNIFLFAAPAVIIIGITMSFFVDPNLQQDTNYALSYIYMNDKQLFVMFAFSAVILAPVIEEFVFRGVLFSALHKYISVWFVLPITAVAFAVPHISTTPAHMIPILVLVGLLYGFLRLRTQSLYPSIIMHSINNSHVVMNTSGYTFFSFVVGASMVVLVSFTCYVLYRKNLILKTNNNIVIQSA